jgi:hypothetical protein
MILGYTWKYYGIRGDEDIPTAFQKWMIQWYPNHGNMNEIPETVLYLVSEGNKK